MFTGTKYILFFSPNSPELYGVVLGERQAGVPSGNEKYYNVSKIIKHPDFRENTYANDVALMKVE